MLYVNRAIACALERLGKHDPSRIIVIPMYPQYAESSYRTAVEETKNKAERLGLADRLSFFPPFYARAEFIKAFAARIRESVGAWPFEHFVFSFHSLPVRHLKKLDATKTHCLMRSDCCDAISSVNQNCYRAQCLFTARAIAAELGLKNDGYSISFQSRLGKAEWLGPQTESLLSDLARVGVKRVAVACPSFVADCLETVEEIGIRARENFLQAGGEELRLVPSLNAGPAWVEAVAGWSREAASS
jgi:ferrochelatase